MYTYFVSILCKNFELFVPPPTHLPWRRKILKFEHIWPYYSDRGLGEFHPKRLQSRCYHLIAEAHLITIERMIFRKKFHRKGLISSILNSQRQSLIFSLFLNYLYCIFGCWHTNNWEPLKRIKKEENRSWIDGWREM